MPSKGGRDRTAHNLTQTMPVVSGPPLVRSREEWASAAFAEAELARPLHRGVDTERFNVLAARQEQLTPEESDELYGYRLRRLMSRLRRLDRVRGSEDEDAIRTALEDLDHRIEELRRFEAERSAVGLSTGYEVDLSSRTAAVDRLLELAHHRVPGLIAGSAVAPPQPTGNLRVSVTPFAPAPGDVPVYVLAPASIPSDALARNVETVAGQGAQLHLIHDPADIPRDAETAPLVINWGGSEAMPSDLVVINRPEAVRISSDQVESIRRLGDLAPRTVARPDQLDLLGSERVVAKARHGARGSGKAVISSDAAWSQRVHYDMFQEFITDRREYRVSVLSGRLVSAYLKQPPEGASPENLHPDWTFEQARVMPRAVAAVAREAARRIGLDYAGVDVIEDTRTGRVYCLEANAAPGMSEDTLRSLYGHIQNTLRGRLARAS
ncbi:MAG: ATP-grasp domain-containing protein [Candidatus Dormibacteraceae bacterium]